MTWVGPNDEDEENIPVKEDDAEHGVADSSEYLISSRNSVWNPSKFL